MMKKLLIFSVTFSFFINSETDLITSDDVNFDSLQLTFGQYIDEMYELEPLSKSTSRKEKSAFRVKFYQLHDNYAHGERLKDLRVFMGTVCGEDECFGDDKFPFAPAVATLNAILLLDRTFNSFDGYEFIGLAKHTNSLWGNPKSFDVNDLYNALDYNSKLSNSSFRTLINSGVPAAQYLTSVKPYDIGFEGKVEVFSDEYNERIKKIIDFIDEETGGMLSILFENGSLFDYNDVYKNKLNVGEFSIKDFYERLCTDIFDENLNLFREDISAGYLKEFDACNENDRYALSTGIYNIDPMVLQNYDPDFYFDIINQEYIFPTYHKLDYSDELFLSFGPEILFNAKYGISTGLNIVKELNKIKLIVKDTFYESINSLEDVQEEVESFIGSPSEIPLLRMFIAPPRNTREEQIYKAVENYIETDEFQQYLAEAYDINIVEEMEDKFYEISEDPVAENLINLKTAMEIVNECYESRLGYAVVYLNQNEYFTLKSQFNKKFKEASSKLSPEIKKEIDVYGFDNFIDWGVKLSLDFAGNLDLLDDWSQDNEKACTYYKRQLQ